jgi:hypothetical protein
VTYSVGTPTSASFTGAPASSSPVQINETNSYGRYQDFTNYLPTASNPSTISFADDATALGFASYVQATTELSVTITNTTGTAIPQVTLESSVTPAGFGFFVADPNTGNIDSSTPTTSSKTFGAFTSTGSSNSLYGSDLAAAAYSFTVSLDRVAGVPPTTVADYAGTVALAAGGGVSLTAPAGASTPAGFAQIASSAQEVAYQWNETNFSENLGSLAAGASETLTYVSTVDAFTNGSPDSGAPQLLAYACFGDPIGKGSGGGGDPDCTSGYTVLDATFDPSTGVLDFNTAAVPEPTTWALLLVGFGLVGSTLRRRREARRI